MSGNWGIIKNCETGTCILRIRQPMLPYKRQDIPAQKFMTRIYAAPMEGITGYIYRKEHARHFGGCDRYFMPFIDPKDHASLMKKEKKDIAPENNTGIPVVPQILTNRADRFLTTARMLEDLGYGELNLNLGCPSGTVVSRGKGSGFLASPDRLRAFFEKIFDGLADSSLLLSVKTRLGMKSPEEMAALMEIYNDYPISELIIHARVREDYYKHPVRLEAFQEALSVSRHPICYNGDLLDFEAVERFRKRFPQVDRLMLGRGMIAEPGLPLQLAEKGPDQAWKAKPMDYLALQDFMEDLCDRYEAEIGNNALFKMKEIWTYMLPRFEVPGPMKKKLIKSRRLSDYRIQARALFFEAISA